VGYNKRKSSVIRVLPFLLELEERKESCEFFTDNPNHLAYLIRQAIYCIPLFKDFENLGWLTEAYSFSTTEESVVCKYLPEYGYVTRSGREADPEVLRLNTQVVAKKYEVLKREFSAKNNVDGEEEGESPSPPTDRRTLGNNVSSRPKKLTIDMEITTPHAVIGAAIKYQDLHQEIHFPYARLTHSQLATVSTWTLSTGGEDTIPWRLIEHEGAGITLTRRDIPEEIVWKPSEQ
jgi:hypothetical protein